MLRQSGSITYEAIESARGDLSMLFCSLDGDHLWQVDGIPSTATDELLTEIGESICDAIRAIAKAALLGRE